MTGIGPGGIVPSCFCLLLVIQPLPFTVNDVGDYRRLFRPPFSDTKTFAGPISTHDTAPPGHSPTLGLMKWTPVLLVAWLSGHPSPPYDPLLSP